MKIPTTLKIAGFIWTVERNKDVNNEGACYGSTHLNSQKIFIEPNLTEQKQDHTFVHEILHAIWSQYGLSRVKDVEKFEEQIVDALSNGLYQVFKDNNLFK